MASAEVQVKVTGIDEAIEKARRLRELIKEAKSLADELAYMKIELHLEYGPVKATENGIDGNSFREYKTIGIDPNVFIDD